MLRRVALLALGGSLLNTPPIQSDGPVRVGHDVLMTSNRFHPAEIAVSPGDTVRFRNVRGGPHNVQFFPDSISDAGQRLLTAAMPGDKIGPLASPLLILDETVYSITVPALVPGRYPFICAPHYAARMSGALVVAGDGPTRPSDGPNWQQVLARVR